MEPILTEKETSFEWPEGKKFALCLTHDVDRIDKKWWHCAYYFIKTGRLYQLKSLVTKKKDRPYWNFEKIMKIEDKHNVKSTFFFLNESKKLELFSIKSYKLAIGYYKITAPEIINIIQELDDKGWEIGVHGSYDSYRNKELLTNEKQTLEKILSKKVIGIRQHFLNLEIPQTWELQKEVGFKYDASFGYRDKTGFREGKILPFKPINGNFFVIPLSIMDGPLFDKSTDLNDAWINCKLLIDKTKRLGGLLTILWHNNRFNENEYPGQDKIYEKLINDAKEKGAWIATCKEIWKLFSNSH